jgi:hypothetical protein
MPARNSIGASRGYILPWWLNEVPIETTALHLCSEDKPSRADEARKVAEEHADDLREVINKLRKSLN